MGGTVYKKKPEIVVASACDFQHQVSLGQSTNLQDDPLLIRTFRSPCWSLNLNANSTRVLNKLMLTMTHKSSD
jgi:hypothetical protein